jgi:hypothetical protein
MKVRAARQSDIADIIELARLVGASSADEAARIATQVYGDEPPSDRSLAVLVDLDGVSRQA